MFEQAFKNIDNDLRKEAGCTTELDYIEQTSWLLFLKYLDGLEEDKASVAALEGKKYSYILDKPYRWESWAAPKGKDGKLDHNAATTGDDLRDFVTQKLFPYLAGFKTRDAESSDLFDVLAYIAFASATVSREARAATARSEIQTAFNDKQRGFLDFVLSQYVKEGVDELDPEKLPPLISLKYGAVADGIADLGDPEQIRQAFVGFQKYLYREQPRKQVN